MEQNNIQKISFRGFLILIIGSFISTFILVSMLYNLNNVREEKQITENAYDSLYELKYHTERLLTTHDLVAQKIKWKAIRNSFEESLNKLIEVRGEQSEEFNKLWNVINDEIDSIIIQLNNPLFKAKNTMDKSLLRRLGESLNSNENGSYYINLNQLNNSIEYLKQYETFFMDELTELRTNHNIEIREHLHEARTIAIFLPSLILLLTILLALYISNRIQKMESNLIKTHENLKDSLTELSENKETLHKLAYYDILTNLPNRTLLIDRLEQFIKQSKRLNQQIAVLFIDLDHFKEVNDSYGHSVGDELLNVVSERFAKVIREEDTIARIGGDEFIVLLNNIDKIDNVYKIAQKLIDILSKPIQLHNHTLHIGSSIGISIYPQDANSSEILLRNADSAMYYAKQNGRNNYQSYKPDMTNSSIEWIEMEHQLRNALNRDEFEVYYQPQVLSRSGKLVGLEALIRWNHPDKGFLAPGMFLPIAEKTGLIDSISLWVLKKTCEQLVMWEEKGIKPVITAVNLSASQLQQNNLPQIVAKILNDNKCNPKLLELEITEGFVMTNTEESIVLLKKLNDMGINISIDDFGTGYSSMTYLKQLPIQKLKIDQAFIRDVVFDSKDQAIIRTILALAKGLDLDVIAEGVEELAQREFLLEEGCNKIQGYLYSKAIPTKEVESILKRGFINPL